MPDAVVIVTDAQGCVVGRTRSATDGTFLLSGLPLGQATVTTSKPQHQPAATAVAIGPGDPLPVSLRLLPSIGGLVGTVLAPDGSVVAEATVTASDARGDIVGSTRSDADGRYRLADLAPGRYMVVATTYAPAAVQVHVPAGAAARVDLRLGTLSTDGARAES